MVEMEEAAPKQLVDLPLLISPAIALPDLELGSRGCREGGGIQARSRCICWLQSEEAAHRRYMPGLIVLAIAWRQIDFRAVGGPSSRDFKAETSEGDREIEVPRGVDAGVGEIPLLRPSTVDSEDVDRVASVGLGGEIIDSEVKVIGRLDDVHAIQVPRGWRRVAVPRCAGAKSDGEVRPCGAGMQSDGVIIRIRILARAGRMDIGHELLIQSRPLRNNAALRCSEGAAAAELVGIEFSTGTEARISDPKPRRTIVDNSAAARIRGNATAVGELNANRIVDSIDIADVVPIRARGIEIELHKRSIRHAGGAGALQSRPAALAGGALGRTG